MRVGELKEVIKSLDAMKRRADNKQNWIGLDTAVFCIKKYIPKAVKYNKYGAMLCPSCCGVIENELWRHCPWCGRRVKVDA